MLAIRTGSDQSGGPHHWSTLTYAYSNTNGAPSGSKTSTNKTLQTQQQKGHTRKHRAQEHATGPVNSRRNLKKRDKNLVREAVDAIWRSPTEQNRSTQAKRTQTPSVRDNMTDHDLKDTTWRIMLMNYI